MNARDRLIDVLAMCRAIEWGSFPEIPLDPPLSLDELRARLGPRAEALFGTARKDEMLVLLHSVLWPTPRQG